MDQHRPAPGSFPVATFIVEKFGDAFELPDEGAGTLAVRSAAVV
jgi:hypothetical protein